jgi:tetratricopeptide (TPR) repeat protein
MAASDSGGWKNAVRPVVYLVLLVGIIWYVMNFQQKRAAREAYNKAVQLVSDGKHEKAVDALRQIRNRQVDDPELNAMVAAHLAMAQAHLGASLAVKGDHAEALRRFDKALDSADEVDRLLPDLDREAREKAESKVTSALRNNQVYYNIALCLVQRSSEPSEKTLRQALKYLERARELRGGKHPQAERLEERIRKQLAGEDGSA